MILYDTDICIELLRGNSKVISIHNKTKELVAISFMTVGELYYGAMKSNNPEKNMSVVDQFITAIIVYQSDHLIMNKFGMLKSELSKLGRILPDADILIASTALTHCSKLVTGNLAHFARFNDLKIENWMK